jgi:Mn2+/Fe2+ NRAMP family transporter
VIELTFTGSYKRLEKLQLLSVLLMLVAVTVSLFLINPEWGELLAGFVNVAPPDYPGWITEYPDISKRPVWVELSTYVE